jgi:hypothetical protein
MTTTALQDGIYPDVPFADYCAWDAVNASRLSRMLISPAHYLTPSGETTPALRFGQLAHNGVLEPTALAERYAVLPDYHLDADNRTAAGEPTQSKATKYYKAKAAEFLAVNAGRERVSREEYARMKALVSSIAADRFARHVINGHGPCELSLLWTDDQTGLRCKARIDKVSGAFLVDLKTTKDIAAFAKSIARYGYHRQLAHYQAGYAAITGELLTPWIVAVESDPPHCVLAAPLSEVAVMQGETERRRLLAKVRQCQEQRDWPGPPAPDEWDLPEWAIEPIELIGV